MVLSGRLYIWFQHINKFCFERYPLVTNVVLSGCTTATADFIAQKFIHGYDSIDTQRTRHMMTYSFTTAPLWHLWYNMIDHYIKSSRVWLKVVLDQTTATPLDYIGFFAVFNFAKGDSLEDCVTELNRVYLKALVPDTILWPMVTFVGYKWLPLRYRFMYFDCFEMCWNVFLSYLKYSGEDAQQTSTKQVVNLDKMEQENMAMN